MLHYLTAVKGIDEARILPERQGSDTIENLRFSAELLEKEGLKVLTTPSAELSRGRGGPRCMSCPVNRDDL